MRSVFNKSIDEDDAWVRLFLHTLKSPKFLEEASFIVGNDDDPYFAKHDSSVEESIRTAFNNLA